MRSNALVLLSFIYQASAGDDGSAFGDDIPVVAPKRSKLTLRKPTPTYEESESAFGDVDLNRDTVSSKKPEPEHEESAFGDVDYLRDVVEDAHAAPQPSLRKKSAPAEESAFGDVPQDDKGDSSSESGIE